MVSSGYVTRYAQIRPRGPRAAARSAALTAMGLLASIPRTPKVQFIIMHHVFDDEHWPFKKILRAIAPHYTFIPYSEAVERVVNGRIDGSYLTFSFDDGLKSCTRAAQYISEFGAKACFFVCPPVIGEKDPGKAAAFCRDGLRQPALEFLDWDDVETLRSAGHEFGAHTMSHPDLGACEASRLSDEIGGSREALVKRLGACDHFAWPFGRFENFSAAAATIAFDAGFRSVASGARGCHTAGAGGNHRALCIRRDHVVGAWPASHVVRFLGASARSSAPMVNNWTY